MLDITRLVEEGKLTAQEADRLQALAKRDTGSLAINMLMSFGAVAVAAGIIALQPAFMTGAALGVALVGIGLGTTAAVFGAIEFYTQWFERLGAEPWAIIVAGLTIVAFAIALWRYNLTGGRPATVTA